MNRTHSNVGEFTLGLVSDIYYLRTSFFALVFALVLYLRFIFITVKVCY